MFVTAGSRSGRRCSASFRHLAAPAIRRPIEAKLRELVHVRDFGAVGNGSRDDTAAIQAALDHVKKIGGTLLLGAGRYAITDTLELDESAVSADTDATRVSIIGEGSGASHLLNFGTGSALKYIGPTVGGGFHAYLRLDGFRVDGTGGNLQHGIEIAGAAFFSAEDLTVFECHAGISVLDSVSFQLNACVIRANKIGVQLSFNAGARPNNISLVDCVLGLNTDCGLYAVQPTTVRLIGGSVEGNGLDAGGSIRAGVLIEDAGTEGAVGLIVDGTYFEINDGVADIWIKQTTGRAHHDINSASFARISSTDFVENNIKVECADTIPVSVRVAGCGFKRLGTYSADAGRPYVDVSDCIGSAWRVVLDENHYHDAVETPAETGNLVYARSGIVPLAKGGTGETTSLLAARALKAPHLLAAGTVAAHTGTTSETTLATVQVPGGAMGPNGFIDIEVLWSYTNSANNKTPRIKFNGTTFQSPVLTTTDGLRAIVRIRNKGATNAQVGFNGQSGIGAGSGAIVTSAHDTTANQNVTITAQLANSGETITLEHYSVVVHHGP